jgi:hypothetical protein
VVEPIYEAGLDLCSRCDLLIHHFILHPARAAADKTRTPQATVAFAHMLAPSRFIHASGLPELGPWANRIEWAIACFALNQTLLKRVNRFRRAKGLLPFGDLLREAWVSERLHLLASSPSFLETRPADWPESHQMCGFLELPSHEHETLAPDVDAFLNGGPPPVFMGFGSLMPTDGPAPGRNGRHSRRRGRARKLPRDHPVRNQPTLDRSGVVHPSRASQTGVPALRRGRPPCRRRHDAHHPACGRTIVPVPHVSDQFLWSKELHRLGTAPQALRRTKWSAAALAARIQETVGNAKMKDAAIVMSARMRTDNGPEKAAELVEQKLIKGPVR